MGIRKTQQLGDMKMEKVRMIMVLVEIFAWSLLIFTIVNWERINKVWNSKKLSLKLFVGSLIFGIIGLFIPL